jgi:membrane associated rhomboid family serine protease
MSNPGPSSPDAETIPHCYRHPDRETYISCQRCGKPICPDCMRQASVGFQCPDCVREGNAQVRQARTAFGGRISAGSAYVTFTLIAINVVMFIVANAAGGDNSQFVRRLELWTDVDFPRFGIEGVAQGSYWQLLTSAFLHVDTLHIALNMFCVWIVGIFLENQLGRWRYLALYLVSALSASAVIYLLTAPNSAPTLGASGAVFGLFGAQLLILLKQRRDVSQVLMLLGINLVFSFVASGISWQGHLGGLAGGLIIGAAYAYAPRQHRTAVHLTALIGLTSVCVIAIILRTAVLTA